MAEGEETHVVEAFYDPAGRLELISATDPQNPEASFETSYAYDRGRLEARTDPGGHEVALAYEPATSSKAGLLASVTAFGAVSTYAHDDAGRPVSRTDAATGATTSRTYDEAGRVNTQQAATASGTLAAFELAYDPAGNVVAKDVELQGASVTEQGEWAYG